MQSDGRQHEEKRVPAVGISSLALHVMAIFDSSCLLLCTLQIEITMSLDRHYYCNKLLAASDFYLPLSPSLDECRLRAVPASG